MNDAETVCNLERLRDGECERGRCPDVELALARKSGLDGLTDEKIHDQHRLAVVTLDDIVHGDDGWVIDGACSSRLLDDATTRILAQSALQKLQRDLALREHMLADPHLPHAALCEHPDQAVPSADRLSFFHHEGHLREASQSWTSKSRGGPNSGRGGAETSHNV